METRVPREGVHSFKQFLIEVAMIVLGVLIALGVEQVRQGFHERKIAREARENFRREIELERRALNFYFDHVQASRDSLQKFLAAKSSGNRAARPTYQVPNWQYLPAGAWEAASATQAFSYMEPAEVHHYSLVHMDQVMFNGFAQQLQPILADIEGFSDRSDLTPEERKQRDHGIRLALAYLNSIDQIGHELIRNFDAATTGVEPSGQ